MKLLPDLGLEETTSKEFTGWEGRGAMGGWTDLGTDLHQRVCFFNDGSSMLTMAHSKTVFELQTVSLFCSLTI